MINPIKIEFKNIKNVISSEGDKVENDKSESDKVEHDKVEDSIDKELGNKTETLPNTGKENFNTLIALICIIGGYLLTRSRKKLNS